MAKTKKDDSFEESLKRLEAIVLKLESDELPLEDSLALFEEGVKLAEACGARLDAAEKKVSLLIKERGKGLTETPFSPGPGVED